MGILEHASAAIVICTRDRGRAIAFYRDVLGLDFVHEDQFAAIFNLGGATLRISTLPDWTPHEHTILGFRVEDVGAMIEALREKGIVFQRYAHIPQDEQGICTLPGGTARVAWFKDPDGNVLSVTNA
jgi:catechol 2,3-dioxygenase-like lactoylglutathione lyase family enzyme